MSEWDGKTWRVYEAATREVDAAMTRAEFVEGGAKFDGKVSTAPSRRRRGCHHERGDEEYQSLLVKGDRRQYMQFFRRHRIDENIVQDTEDCSNEDGQSEGDWLIVAATTRACVTASEVTGHGWRLTNDSSENDDPAYFSQLGSAYGSEQLKNLYIAFTIDIDMVVRDNTSQDTLRVLLSDQYDIPLSQIFT